MKKWLLGLWRWTGRAIVCIVWAIAIINEMTWMVVRYAAEYLIDFSDWFTDETVP